LAIWADSGQQDLAAVAFLIFGRQHGRIRAVCGRESIIPSRVFVMLIGV
jgi:hypothetical protein